jgi:hypothetical protein
VRQSTILAPQNSRPKQRPESRLHRLIQAFLNMALSTSRVCPAVSTYNSAPDETRVIALQGEREGNPCPLISRGEGREHITCEMRRLLIIAAHGTDPHP